MIEVFKKAPPTFLKPLLKPFMKNNTNQQRTTRRRSIAMNYYNDALEMIEKWVPKDNENSNFYYRLENLNMNHLAHLIASITQETFDQVFGYFKELENDTELRNHLTTQLKKSSYGKDIQVEYSRRIGWYAVARIIKPKILVETGVDHGVGSCVLASALLRNKAEGFEGTYYGTDLNPSAGQLFTKPYSEVGEILYGDSIESLKKFNKKIDLFINDSDHSAKYEYDEYYTVINKLSDTSIILGDNSHATDSLSKFSRENDRNFLFFSEKPRNHWYPGAGIGFSFKK